MVDEAAARKLVLLVDHTFVYTDAVRKIRELIFRSTRRDLLLRRGAR